MQQQSSLLHAKNNLRSLMAETWSKGMHRPLLVLNLLMSAAVLGLAGWFLGKIIDSDSHHRLSGNILTVLFPIFSLITGAMGLCSVVAGLVHSCAWRGDSLASAVSLSVTSWVMTILTFGLACKQISMGAQGAYLKALEALIIILTATQLLYLIMLHLGICSGRFGAGYRTYCNAYGRLDQDKAKNSTSASRPDI